MKKLRAVPRILLPLLLAVFVPGAIVVPERSLFEEGEGTATAEKKPARPEVEVARTEEANKLARQLITKLNESYFSLERTGTERFNASFEVKCKSGAAGTAKLTWNRRDERVLLVGERQSSGSKKRSRKDPASELFTVFMAPAAASLFGRSVDKATVAEAMREMEVSIMNTSLKELILPFLVCGPFEGVPRAGPGVFAVKEADGFVIDASEQVSKEDPAVKTIVLFVSADLQRLRSYLIVLFGDNEVPMETVCEAEAAEGKLFIKSLTATIKHPYLGSVKGEYKLTYTHTQGNVFLKKVVMSIGSEESEAVPFGTAVLKDVRLVGRPAGDTTSQ
jgi:hypothetical protein